MTALMLLILAALSFVGLWVSIGPVMRAELVREVRRERAIRRWQKTQGQR